MSVKQILVIDDEIHLCQVIQACIENLTNWSVTTAHSAKEGLKQAEIAQPDVILLDVMMPGISGTTLIQQFQANPITRTIPIVLLTARTQATDRAEFAQLAIAGVITKPFDPLKLTVQIAEILGWQ